MRSGVADELNPDRRPPWFGRRGVDGADTVTVNNPNLAAEGQNEKLAGKVQKKVGQIEKVFEK